MSVQDETKLDEQEQDIKDTPKVETQVETDSVLAAEQAAEDEGMTAEYDDEDLESEDSLTFSNGVIEKIVALAMRDVPGVVGMKGGFINRVQDAFGLRDARKGVTVEVTPDSAVRVNVAVFMAYGSYAPQVFEDVKRAVVAAVSGMTGLEVAGVNLRIEDVLTVEEIEARMPKANDPEQEDVLFEPAPVAEIEEADQPSETSNTDEAEAEE